MIAGAYSFIVFQKPQGKTNLKSDKCFPNSLIHVYIHTVRNAPDVEYKGQILPQADIVSRFVSSSALDFNLLIEIVCDLVEKYSCIFQKFKIISRAVGGRGKGGLLARVKTWKHMHLG